LGCISLAFSNLPKENPFIEFTIHRNYSALYSGGGSVSGSYGRFSLTSGNLRHVTSVPEGSEADKYSLQEMGGLVPSLQVKISNESDQLISVTTYDSIEGTISQVEIIKPFQAKQVEIKPLGANNPSFSLACAQLEDIYVVAVAPGPGLYMAKIRLDVLHSTVRQFKDFILATFNLKAQVEKKWVTLSNYLVYTTLEKSTDKSITPRDPYQRIEGRGAEYEKYAAIYGSKSKYELNPGSWADMVPAKFASIDVSQIKGMEADNSLLSQYGVSDKGIIVCSVGLVPSDKPLFDIADIIDILSEILEP
jgi:hypothetical protein